jgi:hypothetical protein
LDKKENDNYLKSVAKKMTDYLKGSSDSGSKYEMKETKKFPTENGGMKKGIRKKYTPSDAVDDYVDAFSYPGQTNLRFDEIKPDDKRIEKYLKGDRTTGNAQVDDDGNALGNVVPSDVGEKFFKNFEENLYGHEQADASYKRYSQPVDFAGEDIDNRGARYFCCLSQRAWIMANAFGSLPQGHLTHQGVYLGAGNPTRLEGGYNEPRGQQDGDGLAKEEPKAVHFLFK